VLKDVIKDKNTPRAGNGEDFDNFFGCTVHNNVRRADEFAGSFYLSRPAKSGESCQLLNTTDNGLSDIPGCRWIVLLNVFNSGLKLVGCFAGPPNQPH
jgi:hypothetical protein